jgi:tetratricopeptide (TPR) repeat protein
MPPPDALNVARYLLEQGRALEARDMLAGAIAGGQDGAPARSLMGFILHQLGDFTGCARELREAVRLAPRDGAAQFALASISHRLGKEEEAEEAARRAIARGLDDAPVYALLGRILGKQGRFEEAETAWRKAVRRDPTSPQAQRALSDLVWMRSGDLALARAELDGAPQTAEIVAITVRLLEAAGEQKAAYAFAAAAAARDPSLNVLAARSALSIDPLAADRHLKAASPKVISVPRAKAEIEVDLALGRTEEAVARAEALHLARPADQYATALLAIAWRLAGDDRYRSLYDYDRLVRSYRIEAPQGWAGLDAYLVDLALALDRIHGPLTHPVGQSLRHGSQTSRNLIDYPDAPVRALFAAIDAPIRRHIAATGESGGYGIDSAWSVRLNTQGFHLNHVHPEGWLSSAFYVRLPEGMEGREGWIKFGEPGPATAHPLAPEHFVKPEPGLLVLFPSSMWHGTVPFTAGQSRLTCAFDIVHRQG